MFKPCMRDMQEILAKSFHSNVPIMAATHSLFEEFSQKLLKDHVIRMSTECMGWHVDTYTSNIECLLW